MSQNRLKFDGDANQKLEKINERITNKGFEGNENIIERGKRNLPKFLEKQLEKINNAKKRECEEKKWRECENLVYMERPYGDQNLLDTLNIRLKHKKYFTYSGPILISMNPGRHQLSSDLFTPIMRNTYRLDNSESKLPPHLYSVSLNAFREMKEKKENQIITIIGPSGGGKTFATKKLVNHLIAQSINQSNELDDTIFQLINSALNLLEILGSKCKIGEEVEMDNNMSSVIGTRIDVNYNKEFASIGGTITCSLADIDLPYSDDGRTLQIFHSLLTAPKAILQSVGLTNLSYKKLSFLYSHKINKDPELKANMLKFDQKMWKKFIECVTILEFEKKEIIELLEILTIIIHIPYILPYQPNEKYKKFMPKRGTITQKISKLLKVSEEKFLISFTGYSMHNVKNKLQNFGRILYKQIINWTCNKINLILKECSEEYFRELGEQINCPVPSSLTQKSYSISVIDSPSFSTKNSLGGLTNNLLNEGILFFSSEQYINLLNQISEEEIEFSKLKSINCKEIIDFALDSGNGLATSLSLNMTEFNQFIHNLPTILNSQEYASVIKLKKAKDGCKLSVNFTYGRVEYGLKELRLAAKGYSLSRSIVELIRDSKNTILGSYDSSKYLKQFQKYKQYESEAALNNMFAEIVLKNISSLVPNESKIGCQIICTFPTLKSMNKLNINEGEMKHIGFPAMEVLHMYRNSVLLKMLQWEWFGYVDWVSKEFFLSNFYGYIKSDNYLGELYHSKMFTEEEIIQITLSLLASKEDYKVGAKNILFKPLIWGKLGERRERALGFSSARSNPLTSTPIMNPPRSALTSYRDQQPGGPGGLGHVGQYGQGEDNEYIYYEGEDNTCNTSWSNTSITSKSTNFLLEIGELRSSPRTPEERRSRSNSASPFKHGRQHVRSSLTPTEKDSFLHYGNISASLSLTTLDNTSTHNECPFRAAPTNFGQYVTAQIESRYFKDIHIHNHNYNNNNNQDIQDDGNKNMVNMSFGENVNVLGDKGNIVRNSPHKSQLFHSSRKGSKGRKENVINRNSSSHSILPILHYQISNKYLGKNIMKNMSPNTTKKRPQCTNKEYKCSSGRGEKSVEEISAICIQKYFRGYRGRILSRIYIFNMQHSVHIIEQYMKAYLKNKQRKRHLLRDIMKNWREQTIKGRRAAWKRIPKPLKSIPKPHLLSPQIHPPKWRGKLGVGRNKSESSLGLSRKNTLSTFHTHQGDSDADSMSNIYIRQGSISPHTFCSHSPNINKNSKRLADKRRKQTGICKGGKIEDILGEMGRQTQRNIALVRDQKNMESILEIGKYSGRKLESRNGGFLYRQKYFHAKSQKKLKTERDLQEMKDNNSCTWSPDINAYSSQLHRSYDDLIKWKKRIENSVDNMQKEKELEEDSLRMDSNKFKAGYNSQKLFYNIYSRKWEEEKELRESFEGSRGEEGPQWPNGQKSECGTGRKPPRTPTKN